jgi:hypothetical protein
MTLPPERLWVFSHVINLILGKNPATSIASSTSSGRIFPPSLSTVRNATPERACAAPASIERRWLAALASTSSPGLVWNMIAS